MIRILRRWTKWFLMRPHRFVEPEDLPEDFDLEEWTDEYEYTRDAWGGKIDYVRPIPETVEKGIGDCEDYALVAASYLVGNDASEVGVAFCYDTSSLPWKGHVIAYDEERTYSSGVIRKQTLRAYLAQSDYDLAVTRPLTEE